MKNFERNRKSEWLSLIVLAILMSPLLWMNHTGYHDWGGDFAQYIQQAKNIAEGKEQSESHYILNPEHALLGPPSVPPGFPVMLSPVYAVWGHSIKAFTVFVSVCLLIAGLLTYLLFRLNFGVSTAAIGALVFVYNPWILRFKSQVLSDTPFTMLMLLVILLYYRLSRNIKSAILLGIIIGFTMSVKSLAVLFLAAVTLEIYFSGKLRQRLRYILTLATSALITYILVNNIIFPPREEPYSFYSGLVSFQGISDLVLGYLAYFMLVLQYFFHPERAMYEYVGIITKSAGLVFLILGVVWALRKKKSAILFFALSYFIVLTLYPFSNTAGMRLILPIIPIILYYIVYGLKQIDFLKGRRIWIFQILAVLIFISLYKSEFQRIYYTPHAYDGPQFPQSVEVFEYIEKNTPPESVILFTKPRVLGLYADRDSWIPGPEHTLQQVEKGIKTLGGDYILKAQKLENAAIDSSIARLALHPPVFENENFKLYRISQ